MSLPVIPRLVFTNKPDKKHRFRYSKSDTGSHGVIRGKNGKKTYPTVQLKNYNGSSSNIIIRVSLCTEKGTVHVHQFKQKKSTELRGYIETTLDNNYCAVFDDMSIMISGNQRKAYEILMGRKTEAMGQDSFDFDEANLMKEVKTEYKEILHSVVLKFEAFEKGSDIPICELYSETISNDTPCRDELKILDMSKNSGSYKGGEDIILLSNKIPKGKVKIKFFETVENVQEEYASIEPSYIHCQGAIKFKTPPYKANIEVGVCLEQEDKTSEPQYFTYLPEEPSCNGELKICHMSKVTGSCKGGEDVIILCEKVQKDNVKIKFYEKDDNGISWEEDASFSISDIHHEVAIKFKTPPYDPPFKEDEKTVFVCLEQGGKRSEPLRFIYLPEDCSSKRKKLEESVNLNSDSMDIASSSCSSAMFDNILKEQPKEFLSSLEEIFKSDPNLLNSFVMQDLEPPSSLLDPESQRAFQLSSFMNILHSDSEDEFNEQPDNEFETQSVDQICPLIPNPDNMDGVMIDGILTREMAAVSIEDSKLSVEISQKVPEKKSEKKMSKDKCKKIEKYLPFLSNRDSNGNSLLHLAVKYHKSLKTVLCLNKMSETNIINAKNNNGQTALHIAVENNSDVVTKLLENMADSNIKDAAGNNCYHIACHHDFVKSLKHMSNECYDSAVGLNDFNNEGLTPLHVALKNYSPACLDFILNKCCHLIDLSLVEKFLGKSFLHYAVEYSPTYVLPLLKEYQIKINTKDFEGRTPLLIAQQKRNYDIVSQLQRAGATSDWKFSKYGSSVKDGKKAPIRERETSVRQSYTNGASEGSSDFNGSKEDKKSTELFEKLAQSLSVLLDVDMKWKRLATYVIDEDYQSSLLQCSSSPTRDILYYMKKNYGVNYIELLIAFLELTGYTEAVAVTTAVVSL